MKHTSVGIKCNHTQHWKLSFSFLHASYQLQFRVCLLTYLFLMLLFFCCAPIVHCFIFLLSTSFFWAAFFLTKNGRWKQNEGIKLHRIRYQVYVVEFTNLKEKLNELQLMDCYPKEKRKRHIIPNYIHHQTFTNESDIFVCGHEKISCERKMGVSARCMKRHIDSCRRLSVSQHNFKCTITGPMNTI